MWTCVSSVRLSSPVTEASGDRRGAALTEFVAVIAILTLLLSLLLPAIVSSRESARRSRCASNLRQVMMATAAYLDVFSSFPGGNIPPTGYSPQVAILPFAEESNLYDRIDFDVVALNSDVRFEFVGILGCPSDTAPRLLAQFGAGTNYAGNAGTWYENAGFDGLFRYEDSWFVGAGPPRTVSQIENGLANVAAFGEILRADGSRHRLRVNWNLSRRYGRHEWRAFADACMTAYGTGTGSPISRGTPWLSGNVSLTLYNHALPPNSPACYNGTEVTSAAATAGSLHANGVNLAFADGHVAFVADAIDVLVWHSHGAAVAPRP